LQDGQRRTTDLLEAFLLELPGAKEHLAAALYPIMLGTAMGILGETFEESEDAVQDALISVFAYLRKRGEFGGNVEAFAVTVTRNRCLDLLRRRRRNAGPGALQGRVDESSPDPLSKVIDEQQRRNLARAFDRLDPDCQNLLIQNYFQGKTIKWISRRTPGGKLQFTYYRRRRCLEKLGRLLNLLESDVE